MRNDPSLNTPAYVIAIIVVSVLAGILAIVVTSHLFRRRRIARRLREQAEDVTRAEEEAGAEKLASGASTAAPTTRNTTPRPKAQPACSWCYISESGVCKWCAGTSEPEAADAVSAMPQRQLFVEAVDLKEFGWRSALSSPVPSGHNTPRMARSPVGSIRSGRESRSASPAASVAAGKRSFKPGGIYEIAPPPALAEPPKTLQTKATVMGANGIIGKESIVV